MKLSGFKLRTRSLLLSSFLLLLYLGLNKSIAKEVTNHHTYEKSGDSLSYYTQRANQLWATGQTDLQLSFKLLSEIDKNQSQSYYRLATNFYLGSLKNASFQNEKKAIHDELERLKPLVSDSTQKKWDQLFLQENPQLVNELIGFWHVNDPYSSTVLNERLIEHWQRINFAQENFNESNNSAYGTDDRGTYFVRLGPPDKRISKSLHLSGVIDPVSFEYLSFELGNIVNTDIEIWEYKNDNKSYIYLFGPKNGYGEYGLRKDVLELVDSQGLIVQLDNGNWLNSVKIRQFSERVLQVGLYQHLAPYHPFFARMYKELETSLFNYSYESSLLRRYLSSSFNAEAMMRMNYIKQLKEAPHNNTSLKVEDEYLSINTNIARFQNSANENEYLLSIQSAPSETINNNDSHFLSNTLFVYDKDWNMLTNIDELRKVTVNNIDKPYLYLISDSAARNNTYVASELIDTTRNNIQLPGKINPQTSAIVSSSAKKKIIFPEPLPKTNHFFVSDIVIGLKQQENPESRIPITPTLDYRFQNDSSLMIYFETYNVPESGYKFTYFFKKNRWLLNHKRVKQSQVTILADKAEGRNKQSFMIDLNGLDPDTYQLHWEFTPIDGREEAEPIKRAINLTVID